MTIVAFVSGRSYAVHLEDGLYETVSSKTFIQTATAIATGRIRVGNIK